MSTQQVGEVTRRYFDELWTQNNLGVIDQIIAPDVVGQVAGTTIKGADSFRKRAVNLFRLAKDRIEEVWVESDDLGELTLLGLVTFPS